MTRHPPQRTAGITAGEGANFHYILAPPGSGAGRTEAFDETLTKGWVLDILTPFNSGGP